MKKKIILLISSYIIVFVLGFGLGIYLLPILTSPKSVNIDKIIKLEKNALYKTIFVRDLKGSDLFHWGEADVSVSKNEIIVNGSIAPGPDYKLYLTKEFVEQEEEFLSIKDNSRYVAEVKTFKNFVITVPEDIDINDYNTIVIWCESFSEFITAAKYK
ncbi:DM13 domain-containing protein [Candidatus Pelagibacter sp.]|nr:DM13 domain-containing protein [Candidatus Pelagibacter sp.]MDA9852656.1 DM13 domain-containing protein [Candidatus Pelagibacter sp.]